MKDDANFFSELAKNLIDSGQGGELPKRYLTLKRRRAALKRIVKQARKESMQDNMLAAIGFKAPLCVAGETSSLVAVCVEGLQRAHVPVATTLDEKGGHRGTPLADLVELLEVETGREWGVVEVIKEYHRLMSFHPAVIGSHPIARFSKVPRLMQIIRREREVLEGRLREYVKGTDSRIFSAAVDSDSLRAALDKCEEPNVIVSFNGKGSLWINGTHKILTGWGYGHGLVVLAVADLRELLVTQGIHGALVCLDCYLDGWEAWTESVMAIVQSAMEHKSPVTRRFEYFSETS